MNNKNLYLYLTFLSAVSFGANASSDQSASMMPGKQFFSGAYVTGSIGHSNLAAQKKSQAQVGLFAIGCGKDFSSNALTYAADFGGGSFFGSTYMGFEGGVFRDGHRAISSFSFGVGGVLGTLKETLIRDQGVNLKVKIGRLLNETTLFYGSLGIEHSRFTYHAAIDRDDSKKSKSLWGIAPCLGIKTRLSDWLSLDLGYSYTLYQHLKITQLPIGINRVNTKIQPRFSAARIGLSIKL